MNRPQMVGLAVGVVENGRITFLAVTARRSKVRAIRYSANRVSLGVVSKGVAATMVAKLAEQGKIELKAPVVNYAPRY